MPRITGRGTGPGRANTAFGRRNSVEFEKFASAAPRSIAAAAATAAAAAATSAADTASGLRSNRYRFARDMRDRPLVRSLAVDRAIQRRARRYANVRFN